MKKVLIIAVAVLFTMGMISCKSVNVKRESCDKACETAKKQCVDKLAKDKQGKVNETKKAACDAVAQKCIDKCAKEYGAK